LPSYCAEIAWAHGSSGSPDEGAAGIALKQAGYVFWIAGALPFVYYLYKTLKFFGIIWSTSTCSWPCLRLP
jgi:hypothetical protein